MRSPQRIELLSGLAAGALGLLALSSILFGPLYSTASGACTGGPHESACTPTTYGTATCFEVNPPVQSITTFYLSFLAVLFAGIVFLASGIVTLVEAPGGPASGC